MKSLRSALTAVPKTQRSNEEVEATKQAPPRQQPLHALSGGQHTAHVRCLLHPGLHCHLTEPMPVWVTWLNDLTGPAALYVRTPVQIGACATFRVMPIGPVSPASQTAFRIYLPTISDTRTQYGICPFQ